MQTAALMDGCANFNRAGFGNLGASRAAVPEGEETERLRMVIETTVATVFGIARPDLGSASRGRARVALARQVAMYIGHVVCGHSLTDVGRIFARDRTTVAHACGLVEDLRDDRTFDQTLELLERIVNVMIAPRYSGPYALP